MKYNDTRLPPVHGILLLDFPTLLGMSVALPAEFKTQEKLMSGEPVSLNGISELLAQNGFEVPIPDVMGAQAGLTVGGKSSRKLFKASHAHFSSLRVNNFLHQMLRQKDTNLYLAPSHPDDDSPAARFARAVQEVLNNDADDDVKRRVLIKLHDLHSSVERMIYCTQALVNYIRYMEKPDVPVYFLSVNKQSLREISTANPQIPITPLSLWGLHEALGVELRHAVGLREGNASDVLGFIEKTLLEEGWRSWHPMEGRVDKQFQRSLREIADKIAAKRTSSPERPLSAYSQRPGNFKRKFGGFLGNFGQDAPNPTKAVQ